MDPIEKAIRNAFEKGAAEDRAFREKVYRSAFAALDRALQANPGVTVEVAINRRKAMQAKIAEIESEFLPAVGFASPMPDAGTAAPAVEVGAPRQDGTPSAPIPVVEVSAATPRQGLAAGVDPRAPTPAIDSATRSAGEARSEPVLAPEPSGRPGGGDAPRSRVLPSVPDIMPALAGNPSSAAAEVRPDRDERRARRRFPTGAVAGVLLLAVVAAGAWWAVRSGLFRMPAETGQTQPAAGVDGSQPPVVEGAPQKPGEADQKRTWITIFRPSDPTHVSTPSDARAEVMQDDTGSFLRIRSGNSGSAISFDVGQGVLEQLAGKHVVFDVVARAEDGKDTQMSIDCNFGEFGDCGRKRYAVGHEKNEYLFDVEFPDKHPGAAGAIAINSDFDRQGRSVDVYEIRVSVAK